MTCGYGGHSMTDPLKRVMLCAPDIAGWASGIEIEIWQSLGFQCLPDFEAAVGQHRFLRQVLETAGVEVMDLKSGPDLSPDAVYAHDASLITDFGAVCLRMGKQNRAGEPDSHRTFYESAGIPILGEIKKPGTAEAGDIVWLDKTTLLVGRGFRTNREGIDQLRVLFADRGIDVISIPLPYGSGPNTCLHLMSLMSMLDDSTILVDLPWLAVEAVELFQARGMRLVEIDYGERETLACNVLALGNRKLLALEQNRHTAKMLEKCGFEVVTFPGTEIAVNGGGGPTCLTRPVWRCA